MVAMVLLMQHYEVSLQCRGCSQIYTPPEASSTCLLTTAADVFQFGGLVQFMLLGEDHTGVWVTVTAFPALCLIRPDSFPDADSYIRSYLHFLQRLAVCASVCAFFCICLSICLLAYRNSCKQCHNECILGVCVFNCSYRLHNEALMTDLITVLAAGGELPACIPEDWRNLVQCCQAANVQDRPTIPELLAMLSLLQHTPAYDLSAPSATLIRPAVHTLDAAAIASSRPASAGAGYSLSSFSFIDKELSHDKATIHSLGNFNTPVDKPEALTFELHCTGNIQMAQPLPSDGMWGKNLSSIDSPDHEIDPAEPAQLIPSRGAAGKQASLGFVSMPSCCITLTCLFETLSHHLVLITESCPTPLILPSAHQC